MRAPAAVSLVALAGLALGGLVPVTAQQPAPPSTAPIRSLSSEPQVFDSTTRGPNGVRIPGPTFRVVPLKGLVRPYALAFLPDGGMLITERAGRLRLVKGGALDPEPIAGIPPVLNRNLKGLNDIALHPDYARNKWVYFTYYRPAPGEPEVATAVLARARYDGGHTLSDVRDIFSANKMISGASAARLTFGRDGKIYLAIGVPIPNRGRAGLATALDAQDPDSHYGKILRLNDDGTTPSDNPFVGRAGHRPELYALGIRNAMALVVHPVSGELWETENGPQGGDELNVIKAGANYGWPVVSFGRSYGGDLTGDSGPQQAVPHSADMEAPLLFWAPSIALAGMTIYTGDRFPEWKGDIFVGGLLGEQLQRIVLNQRGLPVRRDTLLHELRQRVREVRQGPDGLLYILTDEDDGALLRIEPVERR